ncbi:MAG: hypothetical protein HUK12_03040 [Muribaculaceae bacterium]|nr:hypothetical protein [Muribaculaceae bacterium]
MKKFLLIIAVVLGLTASVNAQVKTSGFKLIGSLGLGVSWANVGVNVTDFGKDSESAFGFINPHGELTAGVNVIPNIFIGIGLGYDARCGVSNAKGTTQNELRVPAHVRFYTTPERGSGIIIDVKGGYSRLFVSGGGFNGGNLFVGPGYMFGGCALSLGYEGSFFRVIKNEAGNLSYNFHGISARFTYEF